MSNTILHSITASWNGARKTVRPERGRVQCGFSFVELLATLAILTMVGLVVVTGLPAAHRAYISAVDASNAQVLLSTATTRLRDELSVANPDTVDARTRIDTEIQETTYVSFESMETGYTTSIIKKDDRLFVRVTNSEGNRVAEKPDSPLVPESAVAGTAKANKGDLLVVLTDIDWSEESENFSIKGLEVQRGSDGKIANASSGDITIRTIARI